VNFAGALHRRVRLRTQKSVTSSDSLADFHKFCRGA
jgi:hypothetical protein